MCEILEQRMSLLQFEFEHRNDQYELNAEDLQKYYDLLKTLNLYQNSRQCRSLNDTKIHRPWTTLEHQKYMLLMRIRKELDSQYDKDKMVPNHFCCIIL